MVHSIWDVHPDIQQALEIVKVRMKADLRLPHKEVKETILNYIDAPGKYLRSGLLLLLAKEVDGKISEAKLQFAAFVELLHLATLIHDDVIDEADTRRGVQALHKSHSNRIAIYAGDYLLAYANRFLKKGTELLYHHEEKLGDNPIEERIIERILSGELAQLLNQYKPHMTMKDYLTQIKGKTAFLFALSCQLGAWRRPTDGRRLRLTFNAGQAIGMAFQLSDDLLDYQVSQQAMGKPALQDVQNGIYTAPLLFAMEENPQIRIWTDQQGRKEVVAADLEVLQALINETAAYQRTEELVTKYVQKAQAFFKKAQINQELLAFLEAIMNRKF